MTSSGRAGNARAGRLSDAAAADKWTRLGGAAMLFSRWMRTGLGHPGVFPGVILLATLVLVAGHGQRHRFSVSAITHWPQLPWSPKRSRYRDGPVRGRGLPGAHGLPQSRGGGRNQPSSGARCQPQPVGTRLHRHNRVILSSPGQASSERCSGQE